MSIKSRVATAISLHYIVWLAMFMLVMAIAFAALGLYLVLVPLIDPASAAFSVAGALVVLLATIGLTVWVVSKIRGRVRSPRQQASESRQGPPESEVFLQSQIRPIIGDRAMAWARRNPKALTFGALAAGTLLAINPGVRRSILLTARPILIRKVVSAISGDG